MLPTLASQPKTIWKASLISLVIIAVPIGLTASNFLGRAALWENAHWTLATWGMTFLGYLGWRAANGEIRRIRGIMTLGLLSYAIGQILWDIQWARGYAAFPAPSDIFYLGIAPFLAVGLTSTFRSRVSRADELVLNLDSTIIFIGLATAIFALYGPRSSSLALLATVVLVAYPVVFLASAGAGLVGALTARAQFPTLNSPYLLLLGLGISGSCWVIWNSLALDQVIPPGTMVAYGFSFAHLVVGLGVGFWDSVPSASPRFNHWAKLFLWILPVVVIPMTVIVMESPTAQSAILKVPIRIGGAIVILLAVIRQSLLLWERDGLLTRERDLLQRAERELAERKHAEEKLRESESDLNTAQTIAKLGGWRVELNTGLSLWSAELFRLYGRDPALGTPLYLDFLEYVHPADRQTLIQNETQAIAERRSFYNEYRVLDSSGGVRWFAARGEPQYDQAGNPLRIFGTTQDITERKQAEEKVQRQNQRLKALREVDTAILAADSVENIVRAALDHIRELIECQRATLSLIDWGTNETVVFDVRTVNETSIPQGTRIPLVLFQNISQTLSKDEPALINDLRALADPPPLFQSLIKEGLRSVCILPLFSQSSLIGAFSMSSEIPGFFDEEKISLGREVANQVAIAITQSRLVEALQHLNTDLEQHARERENLITELTAKNAELERFAYTISHDLKSPIITIRGFLGFIHEDIKSGNNERLNADIKRIGDAADRMQRLLNELLDLSRIGRLINPPQTILFEELVNEALDNLRGQLETRGVKVVVQQNLPAVNVDRIRLVEVIQNLVGNAYNFMGDQPKPKIEIGQYGQDNNGNPIFGVKDNGIGIAAEHLDRVFGLFNKLDSASEGTGIGLALVKSIIEFHEGKIWVESKTGKGTTFYFTIAGKKEMG